MTAPDAKALRRGETEEYSERRFRLIRTDLARIAMRLFLERGFDQVSVDQIAAEAGISQRTFFRYYPSKDDVLLQYENQHLERLVRALVARPESEPPYAALKAAYLDTAAVEQTARDRIRQRARVMRGAPALQTRISGEIVAGNGSVAAILADRMGVDDEDLRPKIIAAATSAVAVDVWNRWVASETVDDPAELMSRAFDLLDRGLGSVT
jgi:AcrR family transcriptional regulator